MARLLIVHHTPSPALDTLFRSVVEGAGADGIEGVELVARPALGATPIDVLEADGYVLGTPANLGYVSGALKHFLDTVYYPCLEATRGRPFGAYVHGNDDTAGAIAAIDKIVGAGLGWRQVADHVAATGPAGPGERDDCWNLGAVVAAAVMESG